MVDHAVAAQRAIVYVTDSGFVMPSLFSASRVLDTTRADIADVFVVLVGVELSDALRAPFEARGVRFLKLDKRAFWRDEKTYFNKTHVPVTALGRLALHEVLPSGYEHILYLDGDTYVANDIAALVAHTVAPGMIAGARDCIWLNKGWSPVSWQAHSKYCADLGVDDATEYFNSGVLAFRLSTWREMAPKALAFFERHPELCRYHDQSALNATFNKRCESLSPLWNFQTGYAEILDPVQIRPKIYHFTGGGKPWSKASGAATPAIVDEYRAFGAAHPQLAGAFAPKKGNDSKPAAAPRRRTPVGLARVARAAAQRAVFRRYLARASFTV
jgi:lipopolysaccharide biosynthesis glycosyltransferase